MKNGHFALIYNDTESGRHSLAVSISDNEGKTWKWTRHLELMEKDASEFYYPAIIQARDNSLYASYSYFINTNPVEKTADGKYKRTKAIKYAHFNEQWIMAGDGAAK